MMETEEGLKKLLVGKRVVEATVNDPDAYSPVGTLVLSDGTKLELEGNDGGCACSAGCYPLTDLNACDNVITNVELEESPEGDGIEDGEGHYRIFVYAEDKRIQLASFEGSDGNGYYGTGWWLRIVEPASA